MSIEITLGTPLADALNMAIQGKIADLGMASGSAEATAMSEYFILMLANGKTQDEIAAEIAGDLLGLGPDDQTAPAFAKWLFEQIDTLHAQLGPASATSAGAQNEMDIQADDPMDGGFDPDLDSMGDASTGGELNAPTGPKAMRNGAAPRGRDKRMLGQINRTLDRSNDSVLHRIRGQSGTDRIARTPPSGPRVGVGRQPRTTNARAASLAAGMANMPGMPGMPAGPAAMNGMGGMNNMNGAYMQPPADLYAFMEQQNRMLMQMQQQLMQQQQQQQQHGGIGNGHGHGKSLQERTSRPNNFRGRGGHQQPFNGHAPHPQYQQQHNQQQQARQPQSGEVAQAEGASQGEDVDMGQLRQPPNPEDTVCKYNLRCSNRECKFAHQSPAAPPGITVDVKDTCTFGVACKNRKCVGRHPSPATKAAHQSEQDCKFFPNCANPNCTFKHPTMPPCRNGGECKIPNCRYTHVKTACRFNPCTNRFCPFSHEEGQRGTFQDKVWVADEAKEHVSERKFVDENATEDLVLPGSGETNPEANAPQVVGGGNWRNETGLSVFPQPAVSLRFPLLVRNSLQQRSPSPWPRSSCAYRPRRRHQLSTSFSASYTSAPTEWVQKELKDEDTFRWPLFTGGNDPDADSIYHNPINKKSGSIAVLGGGLTGLATAWYLTRYVPNAKITIYEASDRLGGWIDTKEVHVRTPDGKEGKVRFERGARAVNTQNYKPVYDDLVFYDLVTELKLAQHLRSTSKKTLVRRFIYYPDHIVDVSGPVLDPLRPLASISSCAKQVSDILTEPLYKGAIPSVFSMLWGEGKKFRDLGRTGLTVGDHFTALFGGRRDLVDNVLSAMIHGIYGGDVWKLDMASSPFARIAHPPSPPQNPSRSHAAVEVKDYNLLLSMAMLHQDSFDMAQWATGASYLWFQDGFNTLTDAMAAALKENPNVTIKLNHTVRSLCYHPTDTVTVGTSKGSARYDKVVSTLLAQTLSKITDGRLPSLAKSRAVTIQLVNLWYPTPNLNSPHNGFGYLIPQSVPADQNPEGALGVIFDSDRENGFTDPIGEHTSQTTSSDTVPGTKFTVMLGGHLWQDMPPEWWPDAAEAAKMAKAVVARHLGISEAENDRAVASSKVCRECIPQHDVGHKARMGAAHSELGFAFKDKLAVAGGSYQPPGVLGSLRSGRDVAAQIAGHWLRRPKDGGLKLEEASDTVGPTGLARFTVGLPLIYSLKTRVPFRYDSGVRW
ncbi:hypothetical protein B0T22DRAFT_417573 [Podospora appendiculata]|uniref:protoporphyrinogen oxidase n=1 Tax=Podospora appendiculata TaxID=314037 RepID=A0AAE0XKA5_9PEZI|nr:hypothetical protein B0T22DRAFT_417573 [Podospora appendiculata]